MGGYTKKRNNQSRGQWLHIIEPHSNKYISLADIEIQTGLAKGTIKHNVDDLIQQKLIKEQRIATRRYITITEKGHKLMAKVEPLPPMVNPLRRDIEPAVKPTTSVEPTITKADAKFVDASYKELLYLSMVLHSMLTLLDNFGKAFDMSSLQLKSAANMFKSSLEMDYEKIEILKDKKTSVKTLKVRDY